VIDLQGAPGGTRTHGLTPKGNSETPAVQSISPGETTGDTSNLTPKRAQSRNRNRNGTVTGLPPCEKCGRPRNLSAYAGQMWCGTCINREERRINTREMWGRGRRGY
jgi:hypothetical protein